MQPRFPHRNCGASSCSGSRSRSAARRPIQGSRRRSIHIGGTVPLCGSAQAFQSVAKGADAYFKYVNARGGVNKRKINYEYLDDQYIPSETVRQTRVLVQEKEVFAIFNSLGTEQNEAIRPYLNTKNVPQLFVASGATTFGRDHQQYPWTIAYKPTLHRRRAPCTARTSGGRAEGEDRDPLSGRQLWRRPDQGPRARARPQEGEHRLRGGYGATDDNVQSQIARLRASKAGILMLFATPKFMIQAYQYVNGLGWKPKIFVNAVSSASNVMVHLVEPREEQARRRLDLDRLPQGSERPEVGERTRPSCSTARS